MIINIFLTGTTILIKNVVFGKINKKYIHKKNYLGEKQFQNNYVCEFNSNVK
jgi:hypothetical protein